jgi:hypothetical protein
VAQQPVVVLIWDKGHVLMEAVTLFFCVNLADQLINWKSARG